MNTNKSIIYPKSEELKIISNNNFRKNEKNKFIDYKNTVCVKPWGHEFLVFQNKKIGIWFLKIVKGHKTSLHCHFNKDTIIIVLKGSAKIELINNEVINLNVMESLFLPHYNFHGLGTFSDEMYIIEIEVYNDNIDFTDKNDLLRINDIYKRNSNNYESSVNAIKENLGEYDYFFLEKNFNEKIQGIDLKVTEVNAENISQIKNNCYNILLEGSIFQNFKYISEGSVLDSLENIQFLHDKCLLLSLDRYDYKEESKIIYDNSQLELTVKKLKSQNKNIILSSGCFDILHIGHINTLIESKKLGDVLMICLSNDEQIKKLKGDERPINNYKDRIDLFKTIKYVDYIILYSEENIEREESLGEIMKIVDPYYWVKGSDYSVGKILEKHPYLKNIKLINNIQDKSTTNIINKIKNT